MKIKYSLLYFYLLPTIINYLFYIIYLSMPYIYIDLEKEYYYHISSWLPLKDCQSNRGLTYLHTHPGNIYK